MESLYGNVGRKLKIMACVIFVILALGSVVFGFANMVTDDILNMGDEVGIIVGFLCIILGPIFAFISSLGLYALGELVENSSYLPEIKSALDKIKSNTSQANTNIKSSTTYANPASNNQTTSDVKEQLTKNTPAPKDCDIDDLLPKLPSHIASSTGFINRIKKDPKFVKELNSIQCEEFYIEFITLEYDYDFSGMTFTQYNAQKAELFKKYSACKSIKTTDNYKTKEKENKQYICPKCNNIVTMGQEACTCGTKFDWGKLNR